MGSSGASEEEECDCFIFGDAFWECSKCKHERRAAREQAARDQTEVEAIMEELRLQREAQRTQAERDQAERDQRQAERDQAERDQATEKAKALIESKYSEAELIAMIE